MPSQKLNNNPAQSPPQTAQRPLQQKSKPPLHFLDLRMIFPILFIIVLLFFGFGVYSYYKSTMTAPEPAERFELSQLQLPAAEPEVTALTAWTQAVESGDPAVCSQLRNIAEADDCLRAMAFTFQNPELCVMILDISLNSRCLYDIAQSQLKTDYCFDIGPLNGEYSKNSCLLSLAVTRNKEVLCNFIAGGQEPYTQENCRAAVQEAVAAAS